MKKSFVSYSITTAAIAFFALPFINIFSNKSNLSASATTSTPPDTITLNGTIRDFKAMYPDFERNSSDSAKQSQQLQLKSQLGGEAFSFGEDLNIVKTDLGTDGKPAFNGKTKSTTTKENFDRWYRDIPCADDSDFLCNASESYTITLTYDANTKNYTYSNNNFFPIDNKLFGNEGRSKNYHFTYELKTKFTYQKGQTFTFTGDDDLFVFINGRRVIDIGGVHPAISKTIDLDDLGLIEGQTYDFALFFAERHTSESNFRIDTSIAFMPTTETMDLYWD